MGMIAIVTRLEGVSPGAIHHLVMTTAIPAIKWESEAWWTGAKHITRNAGPVYNSLARIITRLRRWTHILELLSKAGLPPLDLLLDRKSRQYELPILLADDTHPCKKQMVAIFPKPQQDKNSCVLTRIGKVLQDNLPYGRLEDTTSLNGPYLDPHHIGTSDKE